MAKKEIEPALVLAALAVIGVVLLALLGGYKGCLGCAFQTISVSASGTAFGYPDQAAISMNANGTGQAPAIANANLTGTVNLIGSALSPYINKNFSQIQTQYYSVNRAKVTLCSNFTGPTVNLPAPFSCNPNPYGGTTAKLYCCYNSTAYVALQSILVTIPNINNASLAFGAIAGIPNVNSQSLSQRLSPSLAGSLLNQSLTRALANATAQAQALAGSRFSVSVYNITVMNNPLIYYPLASSSSSGSGGSFFSGRIGVTRSVNVVFRLTPR
ncbi:MAG: SIMPL domain-containing protein [Candidatus Micrarchaeota archaeon]|nr:SIMPL domain-containing protein [Candidatus Micrarchaeota archaeon]